MVPWWLPADLPNISAIIDRLGTWLVSIERSFQGLSVAIKTVRIDEELMEIWLNEVCDRVELRRQETEEKGWVAKCFKCGKEEHKCRECPLWKKEKKMQVVKEAVCVAMPQEVQ